MAPKQNSLRVSQGRVVGKQGSKGYFGEAYSAITAPENASVVRSVAIFGVAIAFFSSSWSEFLLPPL
ncbi:hypothetical protein GLAREA_10338 [Glarea lozoyensis ATCC 20868]|uniref:TOM core complex subunit Tom6 n=1 Tax=Glarea lozoyensis (strain ATCC 20868 / MF5171) TaxID=1116229 RepID=S3DC19_GLAL2|nr:uncharacterized protein GLAREA_10338 [Glarea lozoyensis ATCC 20868]EPE34644.1 hypothetical protein GLAREA_10338 [Glarea lozoyensis ATCC 20868]